MTREEEDALVESELGSIEERLRCAVEDLEAARSSLAWIEARGRRNLSELPTSQDLLDYATGLRAAAHRVILYESKHFEV